MSNRQVLGPVLVALIGVLLVATAAVADAPWESLFSLKRVEANPDKVYRLTEGEGPWLILAATFSGEGAEGQAQELVLELRRDYKLPAYVHKMRFDFEQEPGGRGLNRFGQPTKWTYQRGDETEEIAVLVGEFTSINDAKAEKVLRQVKYATPDCLDLKKTGRTSQSLAGWRDLQKQLHRKLSREETNKTRKGPMGHAFMVPNPLRRGQFGTKGVDAFVVKMNQGVAHSLLDCPGKYTVQVAHFAGRVVVDQGEIHKIKKGERNLKKGKLHQAADKAHRLTEALRINGYEAYEFHDRKASIVTVGSFNSVGTPRPDGKIEINPSILRIIETFKGKQPTLGSPVMAQTFVGIPLDVQPLPVEVPKASIGASYANQSSRLW